MDVLANPVPLVPDDWEDPWEMTAPEKARRAAWANEPEVALRREAEDPETTGPRLQQIADEVLNRWRFIRDDSVEKWILEAIMGNPNVPLDLVRQLVSGQYGTLSVMDWAFFNNPIAPLIIWEKPDFITRLDPRVQTRLLAQEKMPAALVQTLLLSPEVSVVEAARLHIAFAGKADTSDWQTGVRDCWKTFCARANEKMRNWHADLVDLGLAPSWAADPMPPLLQMPRKPDLEEWFAYRHTPGGDREKTLCQRIARNAASEFVAHALRPDALPADLNALIQETGLRNKMTGLAIMQHSAVTPDLIRDVVRINEAFFAQAAVCHRLTPPDVVAAFLRSDTPEIRRAARAHPNAPAEAAKVSITLVLRMAKAETLRPEGAFLEFVQTLHWGWRSIGMDEQVSSPDWTKRLTAVVLIPEEKIKTPTVVSYRDTRTYRDALLHLSHDGNRLVRAAAQTRLDDPEYGFVL